MKTTTIAIIGIVLLTLAVLGSLAGRWRASRPEAVRAAAQSTYMAREARWRAVCLEPHLYSWQAPATPEKQRACDEEFASIKAFGRANGLLPTYDDALSPFEK